MYKISSSLIHLLTLFPGYHSVLVLVVKAMVFPVVMYGCESWTVKKAER